MIDAPSSHTTVGAVRYTAVSDVSLGAKHYRSAPRLLTSANSGPERKPSSTLRTQVEVRRIELRSKAHP